MIRLGAYFGTADYTTCKMPVTLHARLPPSRRITGLVDLTRVLASVWKVAEDYTPHQVSELLRQGAVQLIDVRQRHEHEAGRIRGGRLIELSSLGAEAGSIDPSRPVVFYCRTGGRSAMATQLFAQAGYEAHNMSGGLVAWADAGLPMEPHGAFVADH